MTERLPSGKPTSAVSLRTPVQIQAVWPKIITKCKCRALISPDFPFPAWPRVHICLGGTRGGRGPTPEDAIGPGSTPEFDVSYATSGKRVRRRGEAAYRTASSYLYTLHLALPLMSRSHPPISTSSSFSRRDLQPRGRRHFRGGRRMGGAEEEEEEEEKYRLCATLYLQMRPTRRAWGRRRGPGSRLLPHLLNCSLSLGIQNPLCESVSLSLTFSLSLAHSPAGFSRATLKLNLLCLCLAFHDFSLRVDSSDWTSLFD
jgi:hypothetical protein